ncbi:hypothetical protein BH10BAC4_BH10BAC4_27180 [soil metagenome]
MKGFLIIAFSFFSIHIAAQEVWYGGVVVSSNGEVLTGELAFYPLIDVVVLKHGEVTKVMTADKVRSFRFYDSRYDINRKFASLADLGVFGGRKIYEVVLNGAIPVLRRIKSISSRMDDDEQYFYYFDFNARILSLKKFRSVLYPEIHRKLSLKESSRRLNPNFSADAIRLIEQYNQQLTVVASR